MFLTCEVTPLLVKKIFNCFCDTRTFIYSRINFSVPAALSPTHLICCIAVVFIIVLFYHFSLIKIVVVHFQFLIIKGWFTLGDKVGIGVRFRRTGAQYNHYNNHYCSHVEA